MALILLFKVVVAFSVFLWYGVAVLRFVNDYFHSQFQKQLAEEYRRHPGMRNVDVFHNARLDHADGQSCGSPSSSGISADILPPCDDDDGIVANDENGNSRRPYSESEMDARDADESMDAFPIQPDHHYYSIPGSSQSGGHERDQKPQSEFTKGEWVSPSADGGNGGTAAVVKEEEQDGKSSMDYLMEYLNHPHHDEYDDSGDRSSLNHYDAHSCCGNDDHDDTKSKYSTSEEQFTPSPAEELSSGEHFNFPSSHGNDYCPAGFQSGGADRLQCEDGKNTPKDAVDGEEVNSDFHRFTEENIARSKASTQITDSATSKNHKGVWNSVIYMSSITVHITLTLFSVAQVL